MATLTKKATVHKSDLHPLAALIPAQELALSYVPRFVGSGMTDISILRNAFENRANVLLTGPTGAGKTSSVMALAAELRLPVVNIPCSQNLDTDTLLGGPVMDSNGRITMFRPGQLTTIVQCGGVSYWDEINMASPRALAIFHGLTDFRRALTINESSGSGWCSSCGCYCDPAAKDAEIDANRLALLKGTDISTLSTVVCDHCGAAWDSTTIKAHKDFMVIAAMNDGSAYHGVYQLNAAFKNRFSIFLNVDYDEQIESGLVESASLVQFAMRLRDLTASGEIQTPVSTNKLIEFERIAEQISLDFAVENFVGYFAPGERQAVKEALEHVVLNIATDYGLVAAPEPQKGKGKGKSKGEQQQAGDDDLF